MFMHAWNIKLFTNKFSENWPYPIQELRRKIPSSINLLSPRRGAKGLLHAIWFIRVWFNKDFIKPYPMTFIIKCFLPSTGFEEKIKVSSTGFRKKALENIQKV